VNRVPFADRDKNEIHNHKELWRNRIEFSGEDTEEARVLGDFLEKLIEQIV